MNAQWDVTAKQAMGDHGTGTIQVRYSSVVSLVFLVRIGFIALVHATSLFIIHNDIGNRMKEYHSSSFLPPPKAFCQVRSNRLNI